MPLLKSLFFKSFPLIFSGVPVSASGIWIYSNYYPKSIGGWLEKSGVKRIEDGKNEHFKAMFEENKSFANELVGSDLDSSSDLSNVPDKLKDWCKDAWTNKPWSKKLLQTLNKFCIYQPKTYKGILLGNGKITSSNPITNDEDYKVNFAVYKNDDSLLSKISGITKTDEVDTAYVKVKEWCETTFKKEATDSSIFEYLWTWCTSPGFKTVENKIKTDKSTWTKVQNSNWADNFDKWKDTPEIIDAIKADDQSANSGLNASTAKETGGPKMQKWCENGLNKNLYDTDVYPTLYSQIKSACSST